MLEFFEEFPEMSRGDLRDFKKVIDSAFRSFSRTYGEAIENFFDLKLILSASHLGGRSMRIIETLSYFCRNCAKSLRSNLRRTFIAHSEN